LCPERHRYQWNEAWVGYDDRKWYALVLVCAVFLYAVAIVLIGIGFGYSRMGVT